MYIVHQNTLYTKHFYILGVVVLHSAHTHTHTHSPIHLWTHTPALADFAHHVCTYTIYAAISSSNRTVARFKNTLIKNERNSKRKQNKNWLYSRFMRLMYFVSSQLWLAHCTFHRIHNNNSSNVYVAVLFVCDCECGCEYSVYFSSQQAHSARICVSWFCEYIARSLRSCVLSSDPSVLF